MAIGATGLLILLKFNARHLKSLTQQSADVCAIKSLSALETFLVLKEWTGRSYRD